MKTTLEIPDELFRAAKARAAMEGRRLKDIVAEGLREALRRPAATNDPPGYVTFPIVKARRGGKKCVITDERIKTIDLEADLERHAASL